MGEAYQEVGGGPLEVEGGALPLDQALLPTQIQSPVFLNGLHAFLEQQRDAALVGSVAALLITLLLVFLVIRAASKRKRSDTVLLAGLSGAGKTALFYQLRDGTTHQGTVTSMEPNEGQFILHSESSKNGKIKAIHVVDVPGEARLRPKLDEYLPRAQAIVFLVDAVDFLLSMGASAEYLYDILTKGLVVRRKLPILLVCNKMDKLTAHSTEFIRNQIEKEIDKLRVSRRAISDADLSTDVYLGVEGKPFKFTDLKENKVTVVEASVLTGKTEEIEKFMRKHVKP